MIERLSKNKRNIALALLAAGVIWFSWTVRSVLNPLVLGYILANILHPLVEGVERTGWNRRSAVNLTFIGFSLMFLGIGFGVYVQGRSLGREVFESNVDVLGKVEDSFDAFVEDHRYLLEWLEDDSGAESATPVEGDESSEVGKSGESAPSGETAVRAQGEDAPQGVDGEPVVEPGAEPGAEPEETEYLRELLRSGWEALSNEQTGGAGQIALKGAGTTWGLLQRWFGSILGFVTLVTMLPIYTYFLLFELERIHRFVLRYLPVRERARFSGIGRQIGEVLANFFRGRLTICFLKGTMITIGLSLLGIPYALLLGMGSGFLALVPFVGPVIGFIVAFTIGFLPDDVTFLSVLIRTGLVFGIAEVIEGYFLVPKILGDSLGLHPVVVLASVFVGGAALGMFGFLIAIPLTASLVIVARELVMPALRQFADEDGEEERAGDSAQAAGKEPAAGTKRRRRKKS